MIDQSEPWNMPDCWKKMRNARARMMSGMHGGSTAIARYGPCTIERQRVRKYAAVEPRKVEIPATIAPTKRLFLNDDTTSSSLSAAEYHCVLNPFHGRLGKRSTLNEKTISAMIGAKMKRKPRTM